MSFPRDEQALGFDNQAATLSFTDLHVQGYLDASEQVTNWLTADPARIRGVAGCEPTSEACARTLVTTLGRRLLRRALSQAEVDDLVEVFAGDFSAAGFAEGTARSVGVLLQHPEFVYRLERTPETSLVARQPASPWLLASRLSFLFWGSGPDDALLDAAQGGALATRVDVEREARRLLADPRARRGVLHFYIQWLDLASFDEVEKDARLYTYWDESLRTDLANETSRFLEAVLWEDDARLTTLLTAPYTFANAALADFYGFPLSGQGTELSKLMLPNAKQRSGILTHATILARQAKANQSDPIHRGKFIRERFFCAPPPPPPADLVVTPPQLDPRKTTRERFAAHRAAPGCAACHDLLDPVGFLFEHYDAVGHYRDSEADQPIDASGSLKATDVSGSIDGVPQLASKLAQSEQVRSCLIEQWYHYAFARGESTLDACTLNKLEKSFKSSHASLAELLVALTQTDSFMFSAPAPAVEDDQ
ncbi:MAG: DUF1592 domain-containing protein [Polyangiaceae bacterium]